MRGHLQGARALVTGASRGLGAGVAAALAAEGARLTIVAEDAGELERTRARLAAVGADVVALPVDLSDRAAVLDLANRLAEGPDRPDVLVNNAAVLALQPVEATSDAIWDGTLAVNLTAPFLLMRAVAPAMAVHGGSIINLSSRAGVEGFAGESAYCAAKFGIEGLTRAVALEWQGRPVSVNTITPGTRIKPTGVSDAEFDGWSAERRAAFVDPRELGPAFVLLATCRGAPTGQRFDAWQLAERVAREGFEHTAARLTAGRSVP
jgi:NAD(P)-dependent dehydrogenase (short-subunit alcohol dehydrogenase family)